MVLAAFLALRFAVALAVVVDELFQLIANGGGLLKESVTELFVKRGADFFVAGGKTQGFNALPGELALQPQRAFNLYFPIPESGIGEDF